MDYLKKILEENSFPVTAIDTLEKFSPRDGFEFLEEDDFTETMEFFGEQTVLEHVVPVLTDNNSNYICTYKGGPLFGKICYFNQGETSLEPKFNSIESLLAAISNHPESWDFTELPEEVLDYPQKGNLNKEDLKVVERLYKLYHEESDDEVKTQLAFGIIALTSRDRLEELYPFLDSDDMYIQERAIEILGFHRYEPAREKLTELQTTAFHNGKSAARRALARMGE